MGNLYYSKRINWAVMVKKLRERMRITPKKLAKKMNVKTKTIHKWEQGIKTPPIYIQDDILWMYKIATLHFYLRKVKIFLIDFFGPILKWIWKHIKNLYFRITKKIDSTGQFVLV